MEDIPGSNGSASGQTADQLKSKTQDAAKRVKSKAQGAAQQLKEEVTVQGRQQLESGKETAAHTAEQLADAVSRASDELHGQDQHGLADYASQVATGITHFAESLRNRSIDDLLTETRAFARRNPAAFLLGSVGVGFALSRFLKASTRDASLGQRALDVSYDSSSEWRTPDASQSLYGGQASSNARASDEESQSAAVGAATPSEFDTPSATNIPPGGAYP